MPNGRAVVGGLLVTVAGVGTFAAYTGATADHRTNYVVARRSLTVGERITTSDLSVAPMQLSGQIAAQRAFRDPARLVGTIVVGPLAAGELVQSSDVVQSTAAPSSEEMSFAIPTANAVGGSLEPGDRVNVLATFGTGAQAKTVTILSNAPVIDRVAGNTGLGANNGGDTTLTLGLSTKAQSLALAHAVSSGQVTLVRVTGSGIGTTGSGIGTTGSGAG
ncbi:MAG: Flp pilus assembly protein CpaB [Acidimicrobiales bacterium]